MSPLHAGRDVEDATAAARSSKPQGITTILTKLGENLTGVEEAEEVTPTLSRRPRHGRRSGLDAQISVKPTQLGLDLDAGCASAISIG